MKCSKCGADVLGSEQTCPMCGGELVESEAMPKNEPTAKQPELDMGWYKGLRLLVIAWALCCVYIGYEYITGTIYGPLIYWMYEASPGLQTIDLVYGIVYICVAAFMILVSIRLWKFCKNGPALLISAQYIFIALPVLYNFVTTIIYKIEFLKFVSSLIMQLPGIAVGVALIIINTKYFKKRAHLFTK